MSKEKKPSPTTLQTECRNESEWKAMFKKEGLLVANVYPGWAGPCASMNNFLKKIKMDIDNPKLYFATACSDKIQDLAKFRDRSQPTWIFLVAGGQPIKIIRGAHVLRLAKEIKEELEHELQCLEGKARRNIISFDDEEGKVHSKKKEPVELNLPAEA